MTLRDDTPVIDREHPWPWLDAFPESARAFFNGRDEAAQQLLRCVLAAPATVLFGKSGLGKTSLLQAGLSPLLREEQLLPVLVRLTHDSSYQPGRLSARLLARLDEEAAAQGLRCERSPLPEGTASAEPADAVASPEATAASRLWEQLHDSEAHWLDAQGEEWTPVFILDQFEEAFTLLHDAEAQQRLFSELGNLIQNRTPAEVVERRKAHEPLRRRLDPERLGARFVLSLREDYLPDLEIHADRIPRLGPNRYRLLPMSQADALRAIDTTGGALVDTADAERIVQFLDQQNQQPADASRPRARRRERIEPALLSLVCAGLNQHRIEQKAAKLDTASLDRRGGQLLERFYDRALAALPERRREATANFIETELITIDGTRRPFPEISLPKIGLTIDDISTLKDGRLLRTENSEHGVFVELVHDRVAAVAFARAQQARERKQILLARARRSATTWFLVAVIGALSIGLALAWIKGKEAILSKLEAEDQTEEAIKSKQEAEFQKEEALVAKREVEVAKKNLQAEIEEKDLALEAREEALSRAVAAKIESSQNSRRADQSAEEARQNAETANKEAKRANEASENAQKAARDSNIQRILGEAGDYFGIGNRPASGLQNILMTLAGHRLAQESAGVRAQSVGYSSLQREVDRSSRLIWMQEVETEFSSIALDEKEEVVVTGESDGTIRCWRVDNGDPIGAPIRGHGNMVTSLAFGPGGRHIVSSSLDGSIKVWVRNSRSDILHLVGSVNGAALKAVFSRDGKYIVSGGSNKMIRRWKIHQLEVDGDAYEISGRVSGLAVDKTDRIVSASEGDASIWTLDSRGMLSKGSPTGHSGPVGAMAISLDGSRIATGSDDSTIRLWNEKLAPVGKPLQLHVGAVTSLDFSRNETVFASGGVDATIRFWNALTGDPVGRPLQGHTGSIAGVVITADGKRILSVAKDKTLRMWNREDRMPVKVDTGTLWSLAFSPDGSLLAGATQYGGARLWSIDKFNILSRNYGSIMQMTQEILGSLILPPANAVAFSPDGKGLLVGGKDALIRFIGVRGNLGEKKIFEGHEGSVLGVSFGPDGSTIASAGSDGSLRLWSLESGAQVGKAMQGHSGSVKALSFSRDGAVVVSGSHDKTLRVWETKTGKVMGSPMIGHDGEVWAVAIGIDGDKVASSDSVGDIRVWSINSRKEILRPLRGGKSDVMALSFHPNGIYLASGGADGKIRLWDTRTGDPIGQPIAGDKDYVTSVSFSPDGSYIVFSGGGRGLRFSPVLGSWADELCSKVRRNMSKKEWREWISSDYDYIPQCPDKPIPVN